MSTKTLDSAVDGNRVPERVRILQREYCMEADVKILLVGTHEILMGAVAARLEMEPGCTMVGLAAMPFQAVEMLAEQATDVLIMDIDGPAAESLNVVETLRGVLPSIRIIFLGSRLDDSRIERFLNAGVNGILLKSDLSAGLRTAIHEVHAGGSYVPQCVRSRIIVESDGIRLEKKKSGNA